MFARVQLPESSEFESELSRILKRVRTPNLVLTLRVYPSPSMQGIKAAPGVLEGVLDAKSLFLRVLHFQLFVGRSRSVGPRNGLPSTPMK
jgi:hypothetical protein